LIEREIKKDIKIFEEIEIKIPYESGYQNYYFIGYSLENDSNSLGFSVCKMHKSGKFFIIDIGANSRILTKRGNNIYTEWVGLFENIASTKYLVVISNNSNLSKIVLERKILGEEIIWIHSTPAMKIVEDLVESQLISYDFFDINDNIIR
jgi:hypothetical protein